MGEGTEIMVDWHATLAMAQYTVNHSVMHSYQPRHIIKGNNDLQLCKPVYETDYMTRHFLIMPSYNLQPGPQQVVYI